MRILLTGATGFIGRHLIERLAQEHETYAVARDPDALRSRVNVVPLQADLLLPLDESRLPRRVDVIAHLAQHNGTFPEASRELFQVNTARTQELLDYGKRAGARQFVLASSGDVYGYRLDACAETDPVFPRSFYAVTKYASELLVYAYANHLIPTVLRLFTPYGPGQTGRLVPTLATRITEGKPIRLHAGSRPMLTPTYIDDVGAALVASMEKQATGTFNVAGDTVISVRCVAEAIGRILGHNPAFEETGEDVGNVMGDNAHAKETLGISPTVDLNAGLKRTLSHVRR